MARQRLRAGIAVISLLTATAWAATDMFQDVLEEERSGKTPTAGAMPTTDSSRPAASRSPQAPIPTDPGPRDSVPVDQIRILEIFDLDSQYYSIDPKAGLDGYYYVFKVSSPHGEYRVVSVQDLVKVCHEIDVLETYLAKNKESPLARGLADSVVGVGKGAGDILLHPGLTLKRMGTGVGKMVRGVGRLLATPFKDKNEGKDADGVDRALYGKGPAGGDRRQVAYELGLDVYTDNPNIQKLLNEVGRERLAGRLPVRVGLLFVPGGGVFSLALTPMGYDEPTEKLIRDEEPAELLRILGLRYRNQFGYAYGGRDSDPLLEHLLNNPNYTPRQQAYLWLYITEMKDLENRDEALRFLASVGSADEADSVVTQAEMLALIHTRARPLARYHPFGATLGAVGRDGALCMVWPVDTVRQWHDKGRLLDVGLRAMKEAGASRLEVWCVGDVDAATVEAAYKRGVPIHPNILAEPLFRAPRKQEPAVVK